MLLDQFALLALLFSGLFMSLTAVHFCSLFPKAGASSSYLAAFTLVLLLVLMHDAKFKCQTPTLEGCPQNVYVPVKHGKHVDTKSWKIALRFVWQTL